MFILAPFVLYGIFICGPLVIYSLNRGFCTKITSCGSKDLKGFLFRIPKFVCVYYCKYPGIICFYHFMLTVALAAYFGLVAADKLEASVDLTYYTKASIPSYEVCYNWFDQVLVVILCTIIYV